jgi:hypothetical protein
MPPEIICMPSNDQPAQPQPQWQLQPQPQPQPQPQLQPQLHAMFPLDSKQNEVPNTQQRTGIHKNRRL